MRFFHLLQHEFSSGSFKKELHGLKKAFIIMFDFYDRHTRLETGIACFNTGLRFRHKGLVTG